MFITLLLPMAPRDTYQVTEVAGIFPGLLAHQADPTLLHRALLSSPARLSPKLSPPLIFYFSRSRLKSEKPLVIVERELYLKSGV